MKKINHHLQFNLPSIKKNKTVILQAKQYAKLFKRTVAYEAAAYPGEII